MEIDYATRFSALSHGHRLSVLRMLLRRYPDEVPAGEVAEALGMKANTLSSYLSALLASGFVTQRRRGTSLQYAANPSGVADLLNGFLRDCCQGRPDLCIDPSAADPARKESPMPYRVLFVCTGNSARSIFAESILTRLSAGRFEAYSAGTIPATELNPLAVRMLSDKGYETSNLHSKHISQFQGDAVTPFDFVFTVCDRAANEECPVWAGQPIAGHWSTPDPVKAEGTEAERMLAFQKAYGMLRNRIEAFIALPIETLDRLSLKLAVDDIARGTSTE